MRFAIFHWILAVWVLWRFVLPLDVKKDAKILLALLVLLTASFSTITTYFFGGLVSPELPRVALIAGNSLEAVLLFLALLSFAREVVIFLSVLAGRSGEKLHYAVQKDRRAAIGMVAAAAGLAAVGVHEGIKVPEVARHDVPVTDLPPELVGFEFVQLSDLHCSALLTEPHTSALVERVNALNPKLVLITGDLLDGAVERRVKDVAPLGELKAEFGVWGCDGNHEQYGDYEGYRRLFEKLGIRMLRNAHALIETNGARIALAGVCDPMAERFGRELPDVRKAFAGAPAPEDAFRILMAHQPKFFPRYRAHEAFALQLSGHTHGGQIVGMDEMVKIMNGTYVRGFYTLEDGTVMYVHPGSGLWNGFPIRLGVPSEIALLRLVKA